MKITSCNNLWIPARQATQKTLLILHGRGDSYYGFEWFVEELAIPYINYLLINAPDEYYGGYSWYDLPPNQLPGIVRSRKLLDTLFMELDELKIPSNQVLMFGFSQGSLMCLEWGGRTERQLAGFIGVSGYCYDPVQLGKDLSESAKQASWLITHGTHDELLPFVETKNQVDELIKSGLNINFIKYFKGHTIDPYEELPMLKREIIAMMDVY